MSSYKSYSSYKDSGIAWFPNMPTEWKSIKVKHVFKERIDKGFPEEPLLAATQTKGVVRKENYETRTVTAQKDFHLLKLVRLGDFVISLRSFQGGIEIAHEQGIISPAYTVMIPQVSIDREYFKYLYKAKYFIDGLTTFVTGIREGQNIDYSKFRRSLVPLPSKPEQTAIANFLDKKTAEIKQFIELKEKTIALLKERKTAIINQAVTKGLNPNVEMKDSGIEWLGEVPKHWEVKRLKSSFYLRKDTVGENSDNYTLLSLTQNGVIERDMENLQGKFPASFDTYQIVEEEDLIFCLFDMDVTPRTVGYSKFHGMITGAYTVLKTYKNLVKEYFYWLCLSADEGKKLRRNYTGLRSTIKKDTFLSMSVSFPPKNEQQQIVEYLNQKTSTIDKIIATITTQIKHQKELRKTLINDVVTGKIKVENN